MSAVTTETPLIIIGYHVLAVIWIPPLTKVWMLTGCGQLSCQDDEPACWRSSVICESCAIMQ